MDKEQEEEFLSRLFGESDFLEKINTDVAMFLKEYAKDDFFESFDDKKIHYYQCINPNEKATIVMLHGFCEFFEKYQEVVYELFQMGYSIFFIEHRGHGKSYRDVPEQLDLVHIDNYDQYVKDLKFFMDKIVLKISKTKKYFLFAHSMGGCMGGLFMEEYPSYFKAAVFSAPMMKVNIGNVPYSLAKVLMIGAKITKKEKKYAPGQYAFDGINIFDQSSALSKARYQFTFEMRKKNPQFRTYGASYGWTRASLKATEKVRKNAEKIKIPVLLFQAGKDSMVIPDGQDEFLSKVKNSEKIIFSESKHEIYNATDEIRKEYYREIMRFYEKNL